MPFKIIQALPLFALAASVISTPLAAAVQEASLSKRQGEVTEIFGAATAVLDFLKTAYDDIQDIDDRQHQAEANFTQSLVANLQAQNPNKNVLVYHDQDSTTNFVNGVHEHQEFDIGLGMTQGYEIWIFDSGSFDLAGDGGFINWCLTGSFTRTGNHVDFFVPNPAPSSKKLKARDAMLPAVTYSYNGLPGQRAGHIPLQPPVTYAAPNKTSTLIAPSEPQCDKSVDDGHYLIQCKSTTNGTTQQGLAYYKSLLPHGGNKGQQPDDITWLSATSNSSATMGAHAEWRFPVGAVTYADTQTTVHWNLFGQAPDSTTVTDQVCGLADNGKEHFWIFKDDGETLFTQGQWSCNGLFYAY